MADMNPDDIAIDGIRLLYEDHLNLRKQHIDLACKFDALLSIILEDKPLSMPEKRIANKINEIKNRPDVQESLKQIDEAIKYLNELADKESLIEQFTDNK